MSESTFTAKKSISNENDETPSFFSRLGEAHSMPYGLQIRQSQTDFLSFLADFTKRRGGKSCGTLGSPRGRVLFLLFPFSISLFVLLFFSLIQCKQCCNRRPSRVYVYRESLCNSFRDGGKGLALESRIKGVSVIIGKKHVVHSSHEYPL